jgi:uncharacterized membrane protein
VRVVNGLTLLVTLVYPFIVYAGLHFLQPKVLAVTLGACLLVRELARARTRPPVSLLVPVALVGAVLVAAAVFNEGRFFLFVPVLVNAALLVSFGQTLLGGPSMVQTLATMRLGKLPPEGPAYCRRVTVVWCAFFLANGGFILWLALHASLERWALYTGLVAYLLMGILFVCELTYRAWRFRRYEGMPTDVVFRKLFPPKPAQ